VNSILCHRLYKPDVHKNRNNTKLVLYHMLFGLYTGIWLSELGFIMYIHCCTGFYQEKKNESIPCSQF
jgi:hypothetical protein